jgi:hypothetical protein
MTNLKEVNENQFESIESYKANDSKPFEFAVCVTVTDLDSACGEPGYLISVDAAKLPKYLTAKHRKDIASSMSITVKQLTVSDVASYGIAAPLDSFTVLTTKELESKLTEIDNKLPVYDTMCGFYFDKVVNRIGNTGWDFINGRIG